MKSFRFLLLFVLATSAAAQTTITGSLRLRSESWSWFSTPAAADRYTFFASELRVAATHKAKTHEESIDIEQPTLLGLPDKAVLAAPKGQLGLGGAFDDKAFGFNGRPSSSSGRLAHTADLSLDYRPNAKSTITLYCGQAFGSDVASAIFAGSKARLVYLELNRRF